MKQYVHFTLGHAGYFLIGFMAMRALAAEDMQGFVMLNIGMLLLIIYVHFLERYLEKPKYSGSIKASLMALFLVSVGALFLSSG
ncbi:hypothetical protein [Alkalicoccus chagannorensis]|uniref:hypothetical protein n=1 Tax=Alkalicoccus chagannorensis TaxID=427072 RepID=UPI0004083469|nr:hypothetical protein [Alkalicoccus chagannorensis]